MRSVLQESARQTTKSFRFELPSKAAGLGLRVSIMEILPKN